MLREENVAEVPERFPQLLLEKITRIKCCTRLNKLNMPILKTSQKNKLASLYSPPALQTNGIRGLIKHAEKRESANIVVFIWKCGEDFTLKHHLLFEMTCAREICETFVYKHSQKIEYVKN